MCEEASKQTPDLKILPRRERAPPPFWNSWIRHWFAWPLFMEEAIWVLSDGKKEMQTFDFSFGIACDETEEEGVVLQCRNI